jgi:hypothetical protein
LVHCATKNVKRIGFEERVHGGKIFSNCGISFSYLFQDLSRFEVTDTEKKGLMLVVDDPEQLMRCDLVLEIDQNLCMCVRAILEA